MNTTRIIKVFLASSITELKKERFDLSDLGNDIANLFSQDNIAIRFVKCENLHFGNIGDDDQKTTDEMLRECEMSLFLFKTKAGEWTTHEFEVARALQKQKRHTVFVYFINTPDEEKDESLGAFQEHLMKENIFWKKYEDVRDVKFSFAMGVLNYLGITVGDGTSKEIEEDGDTRFATYVKDKQHLTQLEEDIHKDIEDLLAQIKTILSDDSQLISSRIIQVNELYRKADRWAEATAYDKEKYSDLLDDYADFLYKYGLYKDSEAIYFRQIPLVEELHGTESEEAATSYNNIGKVYWGEGKYKKALEYSFKALAIWEKVLGTEHPDTAQSYNNIGVLYREQSNFGKALQYHFKALAIREKALGTEHPETAKSYNNIGTAYWGQGDYGKALEYYFKALAIKEKVLGAEHPSTATSYHCIGLICSGRGDYVNALEYNFKALAIWEKVLGTDHSFTATTYSNIGSVYRARGEQGDYDNALKYYFKALEIEEKVLGKDHPNTAYDYNNIGSLYYAQGNYPEALDYLNKAYQIRQKVLGPEHPNTKKTIGLIELVKKAM